MGIDFSHCDARWSYHGFMMFRRRLATQLGIDLDGMEGFADEKPGGGISWALVPEIAYPLVPLLNHSDCDGELAPEDCAIVAPALREAVKDWPDDDYDKNMALELAEGMEGAAADMQHLHFR